MKKLLTIVLVAVCAFITGCDKDLPTADQMTSIAKTAGFTAGTVANLVKLDDNVKVVIADIINKIEVSVPESGQKFADAWTPIANEYTDKLVNDRKISESNSKLIKSTFAIAVKGIDYIVFIKYSEAAKHVELIEAASHGFCTGFKSAFTVECEDCMKSSAIDHELYEYLNK